jgi:hypothetical protein
VATAGLPTTRVSAMRTPVPDATSRTRDSRGRGLGRGSVRMSHERATSPG